MRSGIFRTVCALLAVLTLCGCGKQQPPATTLAPITAEPDSTWVIVCAEDAPIALQQAALSLQTTLKNKKGLELEIVETAPGSKAIVPTLDESLAADSYRVRVTEQGIFLEWQNEKILPLGLRVIREGWLLGDSLLLTQDKAAALSGTVDTATAPFLLLTQNIRYADDEGGNMVANRAPRFRQLVWEYQPDILCIQEDNNLWSGILDKYFSDRYGVAGQFSGNQETNGGNRQAIFFRSERYELLEKGCIWLSDTPDVPMSKLEDSKSVRTCTWALLKDTFTGKTLLVCNVHLDTKTNEVRLAQLEILFTQLGERMAANPTLLCGDFNARPDSGVYAAATERFSDPHVTAKQKASDYEFTYTNYDTEEDPCRLDYMLFSEGLTAETYRILTEQYDGYISDHYGACAEYSFSE